jgi:hypothetical protein
MTMMANLRCARKAYAKREIVQSRETDGLVVDILENVGQGDQDDWRRVKTSVEKVT